VVDLAGLPGVQVRRLRVISCSFVRKSGGRHRGSSQRAADGRRGPAARCACRTPSSRFVSALGGDQKLPTLTTGLAGVGHGERAGKRLESTAVVSVTTRGLVILPPKSRSMKDSMSSSRPTRSLSFIIRVPEYESISFR